MLDHVAQLEHNVDFLVGYLARWSGWRVCSEPGLLWVESGIPHEAFNKVIRCQLPSSRAAIRLARLRDEAFGRGAPIGFWLGPNSEPAHLAHILEELGFRPTAQAWGMVRKLEPQALPDSSGVEVQVLRGYSFWPSWIEVFGRGFGLPWDVAEAYGEQLAPGLVKDQPLAHMAAFVQGQLLGTASVLIDDCRVAGIYNLATCSSARGQGVGEALLKAILHEAKNHGCQWAVLRSTAEAYGFYVGAGFQPVARYQVYVATPPASLL